MGRQEEYLELPAWRRHVFWNIPLPDEAAKRWGVRWVSVPKPFEAGVLYGTGTEQMLEWFDKHDPKALDEYQDSLLKAFTPNVIPALVLATAENAANRKFAFNRPIVPKSQEGLDPELQYGLYTSDTGKAIAAGVRGAPGFVGRPLAAFMGSGGQGDVNAYHVDNFIQTVTAGLGRNYATPALDVVVRWLMEDTKTGERIGVGKGAPGGAGIPLVRAFIPKPNEAGAGLLERTYEEIERSSRAWNSWIKLDGWQRDEYLEDPDKYRLLTAHSVLEDTRAALSAINSQMTRARREGRTDVVEQLHQLAIEVAREAKPRMEAAAEDPETKDAIAIKWELSRMRSEKRGRRAELATVIEAFVETNNRKGMTDYLQELAPEDRKWANEYAQKLRQARREGPASEAFRDASKREKIRLRQEGLAR
jgi:hypothetical protein